MGFFSKRFFPQSVCLFSVIMFLTVALGPTAASSSSAVSTITGTVRSHSAEDGLEGVKVVITLQGWAVEATTGVSGEYAIDNVPPGTYTVTFSLADWQTVVVEGVVVSPDSKTYLSPELYYSGAGVESVKTVVYEAPPLQPDRTNSTDVNSSNEIEMLPERTVEDVIATEPGVVSVRRKYDGQNQPDLDIRGGRPYSNSFMLNGLEFRDPMTGLFTATISPHAIGEIDFVPSGFPVRYGDATAGLIDILGRSGGEKYSGMVEAVTDNSIGSGYDRNWYSAYLSGPVPGVKGATFFGEAERRWLGDRDPSWLVDDKLPNNSLSGWSYHGRLDYRFVQKAMLTMTGDYSRNDWQEYIHYYNNPEYSDQIAHTPRFRDENLGLSARLTLEPTPQTTFSLMGGYFRNERIRGDGVLFDDLAAYQREIVNPTYDVFNIFRQGDSVLASALDSTIAPGSAGDTLVYAPSYYPVFARYKTSYVTVGGNMVQRIGSSQSITVGAQLKRYTVRKYDNLNATAAFAPIRVDRYGYDSVGNEIEGGWANGVKHPTYLSAYVQDRITVMGATIVPGVRIDHYDYDALAFIDPSRPLDPYGFLFDGNPENDSLGSVIDPFDLGEAKSYWRVSPRIGLGVPVNEMLQIHGSFGWKYQAPPFAYLYNGWDFVASRLNAGSYYIFGYGMLEPEKALEYELGINVAAGPVFRAGVTGYYRKLDKQVIAFHGSAVPTSYDIYVTGLKALDRGIAASLEVNPAPGVGFGLQYVISKAKGYSSYPDDNSYNIAWKNQAGFPLYERPLSYDQRHKFIGTVDVDLSKHEESIVGSGHPLENTRFTLLVQVGSGLPYTPMLIYDEVSANASVLQIPTGFFNSKRMPWTFTVDFKLEKDVQVGDFRITPFVWVKNLLDRKNVQWVYSGTGEPNTSGYLSTPEGQQRASDPETGDEFVSRYLFAENNPQNYGAPREIYFGLRASF